MVQFVMQDTEFLSEPFANQVVPLITLSCNKCGYLLNFSLPKVLPIEKVNNNQGNNNSGYVNDLLMLNPMQFEQYLQLQGVDKVLVKDLLLRSITDHKEAILRTESYLDSLSSTGINFIILAGIVTLVGLPFGVDVKSLSSSHLYWVVPYILAAAGFYFFATRGMIRQDKIPNLQANSDAEIKLLHVQLLGLVKLHELTNRSLDKLVKINRASKILSYLFILSYIFHVYLFSINKHLTVIDEIFFGVVLLLVGYIVYSRNKIVEQISHTINIK